MKTLQITSCFSYILFLLPQSILSAGKLSLEFPEFSSCTFKAFLLDPDIFFTDVFELVVLLNNKNYLVLKTTSKINDTLEDSDLLPYDFSFQEKCVLNLFLVSDQTSSRLLLSDTFRTKFSTMLVFTEILGKHEIYSSDMRHPVRHFYVLVSRNFSEIKGMSKMFSNVCKNLIIYTLRKLEFYYWISKRIMVMYMFATNFAQ